MITLGGRENVRISRIAQIYTNEKGEQFIKVSTDDQKLKGTYDLKVYATE